MKHLTEWDGMGGEGVIFKRSEMCLDREVVEVIKKIKKNHENYKRFEGLLL